MQARLAIGIVAGALRMDDAASGRHQVDRAVFDRLGNPETVTMHDLAGEKAGDGGDTDMRVRPTVDALAGREAGRAHVIEEYERPDHLSR